MKQCLYKFATKGISKESLSVYVKSQTLNLLQLSVNEKPIFYKIISENIDWSHFLNTQNEILSNSIEKLIYLSKLACCFPWSFIQH